MKKEFILAAAGILWVLTGITQLEAKENQEEISVQDYKITFIAPIANAGYWGNAAGGILDTSALYDISVKCVGFSEIDLEKQVYAIENAILSGSDGIITVAYGESEAFREAVEKANRAGIPVIFIDSDVKDVDRLCYIGSDNYEVGKMAGNLLAEQCKSAGKIAVVAAGSGNTNQTERIAGLRDALQAFPEMEISEILEEEPKTILLKAQIMAMLEAQPKIDAVFCTEGYGSASLCYVLQENKDQFHDLKTVTFDSVDVTGQALLQKEITVAVHQNPYAMGCKAVEVLQEYFLGSGEIQENYYTDVEILDQESIQEWESRAREDILWHVY